MIRKGEARDAPLVQRLLIDHHAFLGNPHAGEVTEHFARFLLTEIQGMEYESWVDDELGLWCHCEYDPNSKRGVPAVHVWLFPGMEGPGQTKFQLELLLSVTLLTLLQRIPGGDRIVIDGRIDARESRDHWAGRFDMSNDVTTGLIMFTTTPGWPKLSAVVRRDRGTGRIPDDLADRLLRRRPL